VLEHLSQGLSYDETALAMGIGHSTVQTHVRNLYRKLNAKSKVSALLRARLMGLLGGGD
jgi:DNA-binding CsgD family transcriptional regulator